MTTNTLKKKSVFKNSIENFCIYGSCQKCTKIVHGRGIHVIKNYDVFEYKLEQCSDCRGDGSIEEECPECCGSGVIKEHCSNCHGKGEVEDEISVKLIGSRQILSGIR